MTVFFRYEFSQVRLTAFLMETFRENFHGFMKGNVAVVTKGVLGSR